jgi:hypothetical protein
VYGSTPLHYGISTFLKFFIEKFLKHRLFFQAAFGGNCELVKYLLNEKTNINVKNNSGDTPLHKGAFGCFR